MAIVTRYFSTASAGAGDGTTWADRAQLVSGATWSSVITGFSFAGSDSLLCLIGPGTYSPTAALSTAGSAANPLCLYGCDSSGNLLTPPDPDWTSDQPPFSDSSLPVIATTTNIRTFTGAPFCAFLKLTASGCNGYISNGNHQWCHVINTTSNSAAQASQGAGSNSYYACTANTWDYVAYWGSPVPLTNVRIEGGGTGGSSTRAGVNATANTTHTLTHCTIFNCAGQGVNCGTASTANSVRLLNCTIVNNGNDGVQLSSTAGQTINTYIINCLISGSGAYGIDGQSGRAIVLHTRLRDNTSGNITSLGNYPDNTDIYTTDDSDAAEFVDSSSKDFRVKSTATIAGMGYGVSTQAATSSGGVGVIGG